MKGFLGGKRLQNNGEVIAGVRHWIHKPLKTSSETGITKLPVGTSALQSTGTTVKQCVKVFHCVVNKFFRNESSFNFEVPRINPQIANIIKICPVGTELLYG
jgi:hypothetical protein